ncbi:hypothetical protein CKAH01_05049 [Colletotrichum kahawae]|uniref:Uncharacterized protein n=1 Tax=Colletotrichum kahawae TaxID=34407 RepID=A0AAD9YGX5_COLKA|nr:hypothetical protein CKAH01_05049 [Colletotrichum kahawae]
MCRVVSLADAIPCLPALDRLRGRQSPAHERAAACVQARCRNTRRTNVRHVLLMRAKGDGSLRH